MPAADGTAVMTGLAAVSSGSVIGTIFVTVTSVGVVWATVVVTTPVVLDVTLVRLVNSELMNGRLPAFAAVACASMDAAAQESSRTARF